MIRRISVASACAAAMLIFTACAEDALLSPEESLSPEEPSPDELGGLESGEVLLVLETAEISRDDLSSAQEQSFSRVEDLPWAVGLHLAQIASPEEALFASLSVGQGIALEVGPDLRVSGRIDRVKRTDIGGETFLSVGGDHQGVDWGYFHFTIDETSQLLLGTVFIGGGRYAINPVGSGLHAVYLIDESKLPAVD